MKFPFVLRFQHDEQVQELKRQLEAREAEVKRLYDLIFKHQFGEQVFDTLKGQPGTPDREQVVPKVPAQTSPDITPEEQLEIDNARDKQRLVSLARTRPSLLPREMERLHRQRIATAIANAHPRQNPKALEVFEKAKKEALAN